ncbi:MAG: prenyltransferase/squalene oxidase repeat-containing protein, partial [Planctomycetota bacterium]
MKKRRPISLGLFPWIADTIYQLATNSPPPLILQFREEILAEKVKADLREEAENHADRLEVLSEQIEDGSWPAPEGTKDEEVFFTVTQKLLQLHDLGVRKGSEAVQNAFEYLQGVQVEDGSFPLHVHHTAFTLWALAIHGLGKTPMAKRTLKYLERSRRKDSGWLDPGLEAALAEDEDSQSCAWTTLHVLLALSEYPEQRKNMEVRRGAVFVLDRMFKRNHKSFFGHPDHWRELDYGYEGTACFKWAIPKVLLILGRLGCGPETKEVADLLDFMKRTLRPNGRWGANLEGNDFLT